MVYCFVFPVNYRTLTETYLSLHYLQSTVFPCKLHPPFTNFLIPDNYIIILLVHLSSCVALLPSHYYALIPTTL